MLLDKCGLLTMSVHYLDAMLATVSQDDSKSTPLQWRGAWIFGGGRRLLARGTIDAIAEECQMSQDVEVR